MQIAGNYLDRLDQCVRKIRARRALLPAHQKNDGARVLLGYERSSGAAFALSRKGYSLLADATQIRFIAALFDVECCRAKLNIA